MSTRHRPAASRSSAPARPAWPPRCRCTRPATRCPCIERYQEARPAGNILNLWPPPIKALGLMGVDIVDLGAPCQSEFRSASGKVRAVVRLPQEVIDAYGGGFIGLLRPELYERLLAALPPGMLQVNQEVTSFDQDETA